MQPDDISNLLRVVSSPSAPTSSLQAIPDEMVPPPPPSSSLLPPPPRLPPSLSSPSPTPKSTCVTGQASPQVWLPASNIGPIELKKANGDSIIYTPVSIQDRDQFISTFLGCSFDTAGHDTAGNKMGDTFSPYMYSRFQSKSEEMKPLEPSKKRKANDAGEPSVKKGKTDGNPSQGASILVGNLNHNVDNHLLHEKFRSCEGMIRVRIIANRSSQSWYGFVDFQTAEDAKAALEEMQDVVLCGRPLRIEIAQGEKGGKRRARGGRRR